MLKNTDCHKTVRIFNITGNAHRLPHSIFQQSQSIRSSGRKSCFSFFIGRFPPSAVRFYTFCCCRSKLEKTTCFSTDRLFSKTGNVIFSRATFVCHFDRIVKDTADSLLRSRSPVFFSLDGSLPLLSHFTLRLKPRKMRTRATARERKCCFFNKKEDYFRSPIFY